MELYWTAMYMSGVGTYICHGADINFVSHFVSRCIKSKFKNWEKKEDEIQIWHTETKKPEHANRGKKIRTRANEGKQY